MAVPWRGGLASLAAAGILTALGLLATTAAAAPSLGLNATDTVIGGTIQATAQLSALEGSDASGTISFEVFAPGDPFCSGPALTPEPTSASVDGAGDYGSGTFTPVAPGTYRWSAHYSGDGENAPADATCAALSTVSKASPSLSGVASNGTVGSSTIKDEASLSGGLSPSGELTFSVYAPSDLGCTTPLASSNVPLTDGKATAPDFTPQQAGQFRWIASYPGDANNEAANTLCGEFTQVSVVGKASPALSGVATSGIVGSAIKDEATLTGAHLPSGEVTFEVFAPTDTTCAIPLKTDPAPIVAGKATAGDFFPGQTGEFRWTASYPGDANNAPASTLCNAPNQTSVVGKATPLLTGTATSVIKVGLTITDSVVVSGGFEPSGDLVFRAYGPDDPTCAKPPAHEEELEIDGNGTHVPPGFAPKLPGRYLWTVSYEGDPNNLVASSPCDAPNQASAVDVLDPTLMASASGSTVGNSVTATATLGNGAIPGGQLTFKAFAPGDTSCSGAAAFSSTVAVKGNGTYSSAAFAPNQVGTYRWTVAYSGDPNHAATSAGCGSASSAVAKANPSIVGKVGRKLTVGTRFSDTATLAGGFAPGGTITFEIYGPGNDRCDKPDFVNTVAVKGNGTYSSDPFVAKQAGRYRFVAKYSGDASNQAATELCGSLDQLAQVGKRTPKLKPRAKLIGQQISIRAKLANAASPTGVVSFRLYAPGDRRCSGRPAFTGALRVRKNGTFTLAQYIATKPGVYHLAVGYSGDSRNTKTKISCAGSQPIVVRR